MQQEIATNEKLAALTPRRRAVVKLRLGRSSLSEEELAKVLPEKRAEALVVRARSLREVAKLFGLSKERIRQIEARAFELMGARPSEYHWPDAAVAPKTEQ